MGPAGRDCSISLTLAILQRFVDNVNKIKPGVEGKNEEDIGRFDHGCSSVVSNFRLSDQL